MVDGGDREKRHSGVIAREREWISIFDAIGVGGHREADVAAIEPWSSAVEQRGEELGEPCTGRLEVTIQ
jgi:hypothetical protein